MEVFLQKIIIIIDHYLKHDQPSAYSNESGNQLKKSATCIYFIGINNSIKQNRIDYIFSFPRKYIVVAKHYRL